MRRSGIRAFMDLAWAAGDVIHLEVGEPNFSTPAHIVQAAHRAALAGRTRYVPNPGVMELREAIADKVRTRNGIAAEADDVIVTAGGIQAIHLSLLALVEPGDGILIPDPGWPNFAMVATVLGALPQRYALRASEGYQPSIADLEAVVTPATRALLLNSPSNPLGSVLERSRAVEVLAWARQRGIWVLSDECYDEIVFDDSFVSPGSLVDGEQVVTCYSFSKTYAMTGWRVGYVVATDPRLTEVLAKLQEPTISCVNAPAQAAALAALSGPQDCVRRMRSAYRERRDAAVAALRQAGIEVVMPRGAFYLWVDVSARSADDWTLATALLSEAKVAVAPGSAFGDRGAGFVRLSLATELSDLLEGCRRLVAHLTS